LARLAGPGPGPAPELGFGGAEVVVMVGRAEVLGLGELVVEEGGMSNEGRVDEVGVIMAVVEFIRRLSGVEGSRGEAMVDISVSLFGLSQ